MTKHTPYLRDFTEVHGYRPNIPAVSLKPELRVGTSSRLVGVGGWLVLHILQSGAAAFYVDG